MAPVFQAFYSSKQLRIVDMVILLRRGERSGIKGNRMKGALIVRLATDGDEGRLGCIRFQATRSIGIEMAENRFRCEGFAEFVKRGLSSGFSNEGDILLE